MMRFDLESVTVQLFRLNEAIRTIVDKMKTDGTTKERLQKLDELLVRQEIGQYLVVEATKNGFRRKYK